MQQGPTYPKDGLVYPRALPERQIYIHGTRRTRHGAFYHIQEGEKTLYHIFYIRYTFPDIILSCRKSFVVSLFRILLFCVSISVANM